MSNTNFKDGATIISADWLNDVNKVVYGPDAPDGTFRADLKKAQGSESIGFKNSSSTTTRTVSSKLQDSNHAKDFGALVDGTADDKAAIQAAINIGSLNLGDGIHLLKSGLTMATPTRLSGNGSRTIIKAGGTFPGEPIIKLSPTVGSDPKGWLIEDFHVTNSGSATDVFCIDIAAQYKYVSKLTISRIYSQSVANYFLRLINSRPNIDGLFTSIVEDTWSLNGFLLENIGDSMSFIRNTVSGPGRAFYITQLNTASHIIIRDGNITTGGGAILVEQGFNITFDHMQVECPVTHTNSDLGLVCGVGISSNLVTNFRITNNNINTQPSNPNLYSIYLQYTDSAVVEGNTLTTHPTTGQHIVIDSGARNTYIGSNKYFSCITGAEITPRILDNGIGTMGIWKAADLSVSMTPWSILDSVNGFTPGYFKTIDGVVLLRGNLTGAASTPGQTLYILPEGFRPKLKTYTVVTYGDGATNNHVIVSILPTGEVQLITANATTVYLDGISFSTK